MVDMVEWNSNGKSSEKKHWTRLMRDWPINYYSLENTYRIK